MAELADALDLGGNQDSRQKFAASSCAVVTSEFGDTHGRPASSAILLHPLHSHCIRAATGLRNFISPSWSGGHSKSRISSSRACTSSHVGIGPKQRMRHCFSNSAVRIARSSGGGNGASHGRRSSPPARYTCAASRIGLEWVSAGIHVTKISPLHSRDHPE